MKTSMNINISKKLFSDFRNKVKENNETYYSNTIENLITDFIDNNSIEKDNDKILINFSIEDSLKDKLKNFIKENNLNITMTQIILETINTYTHK